MPLYGDACVGERKMMIGKVWNNRNGKNDIYLFFRNICTKRKTTYFFEYFFNIFCGYFSANHQIDAQ